MRGWQLSHVSRMSIGMKLEPQQPRPRHDHRYRLVNDPDRLVMTVTDLQPVHALPEFSQMMASKIRLTYEFKDRLATNL